MEYPFDTIFVLSRIILIKYNQSLQNFIFENKIITKIQYKIEKLLRNNIVTT